MKTCPKCRKPIDIRAVRCPYCQTDFSGIDMAKGYDARFSRRVRNAIFALLLGIAFVVWLTQAPDFGEFIDQMATADGQRDASADH